MERGWEGEREGDIKVGTEGERKREAGGREEEERISRRNPAFPPELPPPCEVSSMANISNS